MDKSDYLNLFGLTPEEKKLKILICSLDSNEKSTTLDNRDNKNINININSTLTEVATLISVSSNNFSKLNFEDQSFDLALCHQLLSTHLLMGEAIDLRKDTPLIEFSLKLILELMRVASEVRIFPLVNEKGEPAKHLGPIIQSLQQKGLGVELKQVQQEKGTGALLRLWNESCKVV